MRSKISHVIKHKKGTHLRPFFMSNLIKLITQNSHHNQGIKTCYKENA